MKEISVDKETTMTKGYGGNDDDDKGQKRKIEDGLLG